MLKKTITFKDLDGEEITEVFYFHLSKSEIAELELTSEGGSLKANIERIIAAGDNKELIKEFKRIVRASYGVRHQDGRRFMKSDELSDAFFECGAWDELFMEFMTDATSGAEFIRAVIPAELAAGIPTDEITSPLLNSELEVIEEPKARRPEDMTKDELLEALKAK
jgi:hypothetical protein